MDKWECLDSNRGRKGRENDVIVISKVKKKKKRKLFTAQENNLYLMCTRVLNPKKESRYSIKMTFWE